MPTQTVTLNMPESVYERLRDRADRSRRTIEEEMLDALAAGMPSDELPLELSAAMSALDGLDEQALCGLAARKLSADEAAEMEDLHREQRSGYLTAVQSERLNELVRAYESNMLIRARAAVLLKQRGRDTQIPSAT